MPKEHGGSDRYRCMDLLVAKHFPPGTGEACLGFLRMQVVLLGLTLWTTATMACATRLDESALPDADHYVLSLPRR
jgi:hypothetical protein